MLAWGDNGHQQLGDGGNAVGSDTPVAVKLLPKDKITAVRAGCLHGIALTSTGEVLTWGDNEFGQLGTGSSAPSIGTPVQVPLPQGTKVKAISAGNGHSLAVTTAGQVLAWGFNEMGQLGDGSTTQRDTPVLVRLPRGTHVTAVAAGADFSLALTSAGRVLAWGNNEAGQLGDGNTLSSDRPVRVKLSAGLRAIAIGAGPVASVSVAIVVKKAA